MSLFTNEENLNKLQIEAFDHLWNGRFRIALTIAEKVFGSRPDDSDAAICYAWALLENGNPIKAMEYANLAVELKGDSVKARVYRGYLLYRMSIFEGALADIDLSIDSQKEILAWSYLNKAKAFAGIQKYDDASQSLDLALIIDNNNHKGWHELKEWIVKAKSFNSKSSFTKEEIKNILMDANIALKNKEYWFSLLVAKKMLELNESSESVLLELESMLYLFQIRPALKKAEQLKTKYANNERFKNIYNNLKKFNELETEEDLNKNKLKKNTKFTKTHHDELVPTKTNAIYFPNDFIDIFSIKIFDVEREQRFKTRDYCMQFDSIAKTFGAEIIFNNPFYKINDKTFSGIAVWYLNDFEIARNAFNVNVKRDWDSVIFVQTADYSDCRVTKGQAKVEVYISNFKVAEKFFIINNSIIKEKEDKVTSNEEIKNEENSLDDKQIEKRNVPPLNQLLENLNDFIGLNSIKEAIKNFVAYLEFLNERKKLGLKTEDNISINAIFLGNPGTGKTTVARLLGDIFYSMGILPKGHVVEVDRASLVGEYIGQTAQKTEKKINEAIGGVLFIDEAYTLVKKGAQNDFGQEAIDILLKRMEDRKGEFIVIVAGYPEEMNTFLNSNPGLKSRFTHTFLFEDYTPDELIKIFENSIQKDDYVITDSAKDILRKELINLYRIRDKSFGNARLIKRLVENSKINLSRIIQQLKDEERTREIMTTFTDEVILQGFSKNKSKQVKIPINEETLTEALSELNMLVGLSSLKKEINDMIKLARYLNDKGEDLNKVYSEHVLFLGNPGTGKTTVARILGKIYSALGIIAKGHLVETDRQGLVAGFVGQTAEKTTRMVDMAIGGMLFIDEAYALIKHGDSGNDFGKEAIDILLKRMEDDRGKFIVVAAGYTEEMQKFVASNPGMQSRFNKSYAFEDYQPVELLEIVHRTLQKENKKISLEAEDLLKKHFETIYKNRDKKFGNARIVRNILDSVKQKSLLRLSELPANERTEEIINTIEVNDIQEVLNREVEAKNYLVKGDPLKLQEEINELNNLVGLDNIKQEVFKLISFAKISQLKKEQGLQSPNRILHSIFLGNIGTGKRTIAKIIAKIFKELGVLEKGQLMEVDRTDFIASYQGQTAIKTDKLLQQALGGVILIKESHLLFQEDDPFAIEAVETIIKRMEDWKGKFVVILSGSTMQMQKLIYKNPGLTSYFPHLFNFEDYSPRQLLAIAASLAEKIGYFLDEGALQEMQDIFSKLYAKRDESFQNGLLSKNILYSSITNQEERIFSIYGKEEVDLKTIILEDVEKISI